MLINSVRLVNTHCFVTYVFVVCDCGPALLGRFSLPVSGSLGSVVPGIMRVRQSSNRHPFKVVQFLLAVQVCSEMCLFFRAAAEDGT